MSTDGASLLNFLDAPVVVGDADHGYIAFDTDPFMFTGEFDVAHKFLPL